MNTDSMPEGWEQYLPEIEAAVEGRIQQVKEKFGQLRVYTGPMALADSLKIAQIAQKCAATCMMCGTQGDQVEFRKALWIGPRCATCEAKWATRHQIKR